MDNETRAAAHRLVTLAQGDTGQSRIAANFVLAWWNAGTCGGFDLMDVFSVDHSVRADMIRVFSYLGD